MGAMQYMRAHGHRAGPSDCPRLAGGLAGLVAGLPAAGLLTASGALHASARALGIDPWFGLALFGLGAAVAGVLYGQVFQRAADDRSGGWLFGIGFGFLLWMVGPTTLVQWITRRPLATGREAMALLGSYLVYGLALGTLYPWLHARVRGRFGAEKRGGRRRSYEADRAPGRPG
jgi:hypothetical protein